MSSVIEEKQSWRRTLSSCMRPQVVAMMFLGFSAGLPILLIFSTLSLWLAEAGLAKSSVTFFSWAALGYSFKFIWAPLIDRIPLPVLTRKLGRRRSWLLVAQLGIVTAICAIASIDPLASNYSLSAMAAAAVLLGFSSASQDIVIDAYRIESVEESLQALLAGMYVAGYRIGMLVAGAGALFIAQYLGSTEQEYVYGAWRTTYLCMAGAMLIGILTTLVISEPENTKARANSNAYSLNKYLRFFTLFLFVVTTFVTAFFWSGPWFSEMKTVVLGTFSISAHVVSFLLACLRFIFAVVIAGGATWAGISMGIIDRRMAFETYIEPIQDFFIRYGLKTALILLILMGCYRISDVVLGSMTNIFYTDLGFSKYAIGGITKGYGLGMTILGGILGGFLTLRYGVYTILFLGALLSAATNLLFMLLAIQGEPDIAMLTLVIAFDNLSGGLASTAFVAFLSSLTSISFTAVQYALFTSLMTLLPKLISGYSGSIVESLSYNYFFVITALMGVPVLLLVIVAGCVVKKQQFLQDERSG